MAAGDTFDGKEVNTDVKLMIHMDSMEEALHTVSILAEGGTMISPLKPHARTRKKQVLKADIRRDVLWQT